MIKASIDFQFFPIKSSKVTNQYFLAFSIDMMVLIVSLIFLFNQINYFVNMSTWYNRMTATFGKMTQLVSSNKLGHSSAGPSGTASVKRMSLLQKHSSIVMTNQSNGPSFIDYDKI